MHTFACLLVVVLSVCLSVCLTASDYFFDIFKGIKFTCFHLVNIKSGKTLVYSNYLSIRTYITIVYWKLQIIKKINYRVICPDMYTIKCILYKYSKFCLTTSWLVYVNRCYYSHCLVKRLFNKILVLSTFIVKLRSILDKIIARITMRINW